MISKGPAEYTDFLSKVRALYIVYETCQAGWTSIFEVSNEIAKDRSAGDITRRHELNLPIVEPTTQPISMVGVKGIDTICVEKGSC